MMLTDQEIDALWPEITLPQKVARREILRKGIAANNAKALDGMKPATVYQVEEAYNTWELSGDSNSKEPQFYSADQVAPLIQRVKELEAALISSKAAYEELDIELCNALQHYRDIT